MKRGPDTRCGTMIMMNQIRWMLPIAGTLLVVTLLSAQAPAPPSGVSATGFDSHIELRWQPNADASVTGYQIYRSTDGGLNYTLFKNVGTAGPAGTLDWTGDEGQALTRHYRMKAVKNNGLTSDFSDPVSAQTKVLSDEELLEMVQRSTFRYFWDYGHPASGMARERNNGDPDIVTTGGSGFGIMALVVGAERGWVTREAAVNRLVQIVSFLQVADRYHGVFSHWMDGNTGNTIPFSQFDDGADLVETAFLMQGLLSARQYFNQNTPLEKAVRDIITGLWEDVEWDWFRKNGGPVLYWHWSPKYAWQMNFPLRGFFEAQIVYLLAASSPTHPVPGSLYQTGWASSGSYCSNTSYFGYKYYCGGYGGGPLFFAHYSYLGFDPRGWKDACCNYFIRNRNHSLIQWSYAKSNPEHHAGYGDNCWGLTACDGPNGYSAHDIYPNNDDGTVAPTGALSSMPYTPDQSLAALKHFYRDLGKNLWGIYGFYDSFNQDQNWYADSYLAIDEGPIVGMIENYRSGLLWKMFMQNPEIVPGLLACGFQPDNSVGAPAVNLPGFELNVYPNPTSAGSFSLEFSLAGPETISAGLVDLMGGPVRQLLSNRQMPAGLHREPASTAGLPPGIYYLNVRNASGQTLLRKVVLEK